MAELLRRLGSSDLDVAGMALRESILGGPRASGPFLLVDSDGSLNGPFGLMLHAPGVGAALSALGEAIRYGSSLEGRVREIAILAVGATRCCEFEVWAHRQVAAAMGFSTDEVESLIDGSWRSEIEAESVAHEVSVALAQGSLLPDDLAARLVEVLGEQGAVELVTLVGYYCTLAMLLQSFQTQTPTP